MSSCFALPGAVSTSARAVSVPCHRMPVHVVCGVSRTGFSPMGGSWVREGAATQHARGGPACSSAAASPSPMRSSLGSSMDVERLPGAVQPVAALLASIVHFLLAVINRTRDAFAACFPQLASANAEEVRSQLKSMANTAKLAAFIAPFAKAAASESLTAVYTRTFERAAFGFAKMYLFCLFMRVLLSWFPSIDWNAQPWTFLRLITEPYLQIYRGILPPLFGQLDFTPLLGFLILQDVVEVMAPTYTMGMHAGDTSTRWTTSDVMCYFDGF